jgi:hypothetical protein
MYQVIWQAYNGEKCKDYKISGHTEKGTTANIELYRKHKFIFPARISF